MKMELDNKDKEIYAQRVQAWDAVSGPRVGDYCKLIDGTLRRFTHNWGDSLQTTVSGSHPCYGDASFYFGCGYMSFSGSLDSSIPVDQFADTRETKNGSAWFFHHNYAKAHNRISVTVPCKVFQQQAKAA